MALPNPLPDNPLRWDGWKQYNSPNLYDRLCLDFTSNASTEVIEDNCRQLLVWWQKKLPLKNQPSNPVAQILRQGLDEAPQFLVEARTKLLDPEARRIIDQELHQLVVLKLMEEFKKLLSFSITDQKLSEEGEERLFLAGEKIGLSRQDMMPVVEAELARTGTKRTVKEEAPPPAPPVAAPAATQSTTQTAPGRSSAPVAASGSPADEFRRLLTMSRLCIEGDDMTDDQRDAMCNMGESLGLTGGEAEDLIDEYLEKVAVLPAQPATPVRTAAPVRPAQNVVRPAAPKPSAAKPGAPKSATPPVAQPRPAASVNKEPVKEINLSPAGRAMERQKYNNFTNSIGAQMLLIPSGQFMMGSDQPDAQPNEKPVTPVKLSCFYIARFPVTNAQYEQFDPLHRSKRAAWANDNHPVIYVSWVDAEAFCKWLSQRDGRRYRLPTEAEWEYAARGEDEHLYPWGGRLNSGTLANFADAQTNFVWRDPSIDDGFAETSPVGSYPLGASPFGIEDMAGNVFEWCMDWHDVYKGKEVVNPCNTKFGQKRVYRGGSWKSRAASLRACCRNSNIPTYLGNDVGFRIVCECD